MQNYWLVPTMSSREHLWPRSGLLEGSMPLKLRILDVKSLNGVDLDLSTKTKKGMRTCLFNFVL